MKYKKEELAKLHDVLYEILGEIDRVCKILHIPYFIQGGSAMGAFFYQAILPWDDDVDVGMLRSDYNRFLKEAPAVINPKYFIQHISTEPSTNAYWIKIRKNNTLFIEEDNSHINIHHGIFVDIFPYDSIPDSSRLETIQRNWIRYINMFYTMNQLGIFRGCNVVTYWFYKLPPSFLHRIQTFISKMWNWKKCKYVNIALMPKDQILKEYVLNTVLTPFGPLMVPIPNNIETYLRHHYGDIKKELPEEEQINHYPMKLSFGDE